MATRPSPAFAVLARLRKRGLTLALAESCTGGLVSHWLTEVPGSSDVYRGGVVAYADFAKRKGLGVPAGVIARKGAVSRETAARMAEGARRRMRASVGVGITGIAGPSGAVPGKPVGLVFIALSDGRGTAVKRFRFAGGRSAVKRRAARKALDLLRRRLSRT